MAETELHPRDRSTGGLLKELAEEVKTLARQELAMARAEVTEKGKRLAPGAGMLIAAVLLAFFAFATFTACFVLLLALALPASAAAAIVGGVYALVAVGLALVGRSTLKSAGPPMPEETVESVKEDVRWAKTHMSSAKK